MAIMFSSIYLYKFTLSPKFYNPFTLRSEPPQPSDFFRILPYKYLKLIALHTFNPRKMFNVKLSAKFFKVVIVSRET